MPLLTYICEGTLDSQTLEFGLPDSRGVIARNADKQSEGPSNMRARLTE